jgi:peroxin-6
VRGPVPHPDVRRLAERFRRRRGASAGGSSLDATTGAVSVVVGTDPDHHVTAALHRAASDSGRRCVDAGHSWAAFGYLRGAAQPSSGSLADKLRGLDVAAKLALEHAPSVLVLRLDGELSTDKHDRHDQESRVWSLLSHAVERNSDARGDAACVMVVLVTANSLDADGPLAQRLVAAPFTASRPDDRYIRYLWKGPAIDLDHRCIELLRGRPAAEIEKLFRICREDVDRRLSELKDTFQRLKSCCQQIDQARRNQSHAQSRIPAVRWEDIGGLDHVREEILEAIELPLRYPHLLPSGSESVRTGLLLWGPPGTGKTLVAKAVATECSLPFLSVRGPELMGSYIGESEENVRNVFTSARRLASQNQPPAAVLFFDELDSLAARRGGRASGGNVTDRVVATLLAELDRRSGGIIVFCIGATNRPDLLDPALLRPGRLDRLIYLGVEASDHARILLAHFRRLQLDGDAEHMASLVAQHLPANVTGADLSAISTAALVCAADRLCLAAESELARRNMNGEMITLKEVLDSWDEATLSPLATLADLLEAANRVVPSVDESELLRYTNLRTVFSRLTN